MDSSSSSGQDDCEIKHEFDDKVEFTSDPLANEHEEVDFFCEQSFIEIKQDSTSDCWTMDDVHEDIKLEEGTTVKEENLIPEVLASKRKLLRSGEDTETEVAQDSDSDCSSEIDSMETDDIEEAVYGNELETSGGSDIEEQPVEEESANTTDNEPKTPVTCGRSSSTWCSQQKVKFSPLKFTGPPRGAPTINKDSTPFSVLMLYFTAVVHLLVEQTNLYYRQYLDGTSSPSSEPDVTLAEIYLFLALIVQMGHDVRDTMKDYWARSDQFHTPFFGNTMKRDRFCHILRFLHFEDNDRKIDKNNPDHDRFWKMRNIFDILNNNFAKYYNPSEHLLVCELIVKFKEKVVFRQYVPKKHKQFGIKIYKLCDKTGYTYDMKVYLGKVSDNVTNEMTAKHATVRSLTGRVEWVGHKLFMDDFFSSPALFDDLLSKKINCFGTVRSNQEGMPADFRSELKLKRGDVRTRVRNRLTAMLWKDKRDVLMLTNMHPTPKEGNFCDQHGNAIRPAIIEDYNRFLGFYDLNDQMANRYSISRRTFKWTKKLFFHFFDLTILNSWLLLSSCGAKCSHRDFRLLLVRNLVEEGGKMEQPHPLMRGKPNTSMHNISRLESQQNEHWPRKGNRLRCRVCSARKRTVQTMYHCKKCGVGLCIDSCFEEYHTQRNISAKARVPANRESDA